MLAWTLFRSAAILVLAIGMASAHHPTSVNYDAAKSGTLTGKIAKVQWANPHVVLALDVAASDGRIERWFIEGYPPNTLRRQGWDQNLLGEGVQITVTGWHARNAALKIFSGGEMTFPDGSKRQFGTGPNSNWRCADGSTDCATAKWIPTIAE
jgi:hypothetical protein